MTVVTDTLSSPPDPAIENNLALQPFFDQLYALEHDPTRSVHIIQFGDSHTAADYFTGELRTQFQEKFGNGGAGYSYAGHPFAGYKIAGTSRSQSAGWTTVGTHFTRLPDAMLGLGGVGIESEHAGEHIELDAQADHAEIQYLIQPQGGHFTITVDGLSPEERSSISTDGEFGPGSHEIQISPGTHHLAIDLAGDGNVRLLGWITQNNSGITYEALGINGAEAPLILRWDENMQSTYLKERTPALVVLAYGTNEAANRSWTYDEYRKSFIAILNRIRSAVPQAAILVLGPGDRYTNVRRRSWTPYVIPTDQIIAAQKSACKEFTCAYWDERERMGGPGSMRDWVYAELAQGDHTHFTGAGYEQLAKALFSDLMQQYAGYTRFRERKSTPQP